MLSRRLKPRFSLRLLLVVVTIAALLLGFVLPMFVERPVTVKETEGLKVGMTEWQVRWKLGAPHRTGGDLPGVSSFGFDYADREELPLSYFYVRFRNGRVISADKEHYLTVSQSSFDASINVCRNQSDEIGLTPFGPCPSETSCP